MSAIAIRWVGGPAVTWPEAHVPRRQRAAPLHAAERLIPEYATLRRPDHRPAVYSAAKLRDLLSI